MQHMFLIFSTCLILIGAQDCKDEKYHFKDKYRKTDLPPGGDDGKVRIESSIHLRNIMEVNEIQQLLSVEMSIRLYWTDSRIEPNPEYFFESDSLGQYMNMDDKCVWMPDIYIDQAKSMRNPTYYNHPASLRIYNNSLMRYSSRFNLDVACNMKFHRFPVDEQDCMVRMESYDFTRKKMEISWRPESESNISPDISLAKFKFPNTSFIDYPSVSPYPGIIVKIHLKRKLNYQLTHTYIPSAVFVGIAWLSLLLPPNYVPGRCMMFMTTLLTLVTLETSVARLMPPVNYLTVLDIWLVVSIMFVFICIIEFVIVTHLIRTEREEYAHKFEYACIICFPILFLIFNLLYWLEILPHYCLDEC